ncbi:MAG: hypothetical protein FGM23_00730 [Alphaproteobacteria bacterium]|nr:hypothetical protein [Alphaproteobacteria bacterium]
MLNLEIYTPDNLLAGAVPLGGGNPRDVVYHHASVALDTEQVQLIYTVEGQYAYYIAAPSYLFAGHAESITPMAAALPGTKGHRGDGAYIAPSETGFAVVIRRGVNLYSFVGDRQSAEAFVARYGVDIYAADNALALPWEGYYVGEMKRVNRASFWATLAGAVVAIIAACLWMILASQTASMEQDIAQNRQKARDQVSGLVKDFSDFAIHPLHRSLSEIQTFVSKVGIIEGFINLYQVDASKVKKWSIELPTYVTADVIERLGDKPEVTNPPDKPVIVVKFDSSQKK